MQKTPAALRTEELIRTARLVVELGTESHGPNAFAPAVMLDLSSQLSGQALDQVLRAARTLSALLRSCSMEELEALAAKRRKPSNKSVQAELRPIDSPDLQPYRLKEENIIGRSKKCDVSLRSAKVSRQHVVLKRATQSFVIEDLGSVNHTWVNGTKVDRPQPLQDGDVISLGDLSFEYHVIPGPSKSANGSTP